MKNHSLKELCELISIQIDPSAHANETYLGLEHIAPARFLRIGGGQASDVQSSKFIFQKGDILYSKLRPYLDKAILADCPGVCTTELLVLRPHPGIDPRFLLCIVHSPDFVQHALSGVTGSQHPRTSWHRIAEFEIPHFIIHDQITVSTIVWKIQHAIMLSEKILQKTEQLKNTIIEKLFSQGLQSKRQKDTEIGLIPDHWAFSTLHSYIIKPEYGFTASANRTAIGPKFLRITDIQDGNVNWNSVPFCSCDKKNLAEKRLVANDIVVARIGATTGKAFLIESCPEAIFASYLIRLRTKESMLDPRFLYYFMQSSGYWNQIEKQKGGKLKGGINIPILSSLCIAIPSQTEQHEIIKILESIDQKIHIQKNKQVILKNTF